jgi:hypothetical protein
LELSVRAVVTESRAEQVYQKDSWKEIWRTRTLTDELGSMRKTGPQVETLCEKQVS